MSDSYLDDYFDDDGYGEFIVKEDGVLKKYIPSYFDLMSQLEDTDGVLVLPNDVHTIGRLCFSPDDVPLDPPSRQDTDLAFSAQWDNWFPVKEIEIPANIKKIEETAFNDVACLKAELRDIDEQMGVAA